ncbi:NAD(P)H-hydrate epimerase, partial [Thermoproteota archaeon]
GNNGADGIAAARYLHNKRVDVEVVLGVEETRLCETAMRHLDAAKVLGIPIIDTVGKRPDLFIDCLLGYNAKGAPRERIAEIISHVKGLEVPVLSCDVPTGLELSTGKWHEPCFENAVCLTLGLPKKGMIDDSKIKRLLVGDLGIPPEVYKKAGVDATNLFVEKDYVDV